MSKLCVKKCKNCKGERCPNYYGYIPDKKAYYGGVLHAVRVKFQEDKQQMPLDKFDKAFIVGFIILTVVLHLTGGLIP